MSDDHVTEVEEFDATLDLRSAIPMQIIILSMQIILASESSSPLVQYNTRPLKRVW